jgi:hypothetical protein
MIHKLIIIIILSCFIFFITRTYYNNKTCNDIVYDKFNSDLKSKFKSEIETNPNLELQKSKCWISTNEFPEAKLIFDSRHIIIQELYNVLNSDKWGIWSSDHTTTPMYTKMTTEEILSRIYSNAGKIGSVKEPSWRLFGLILNKIILPTAECCPNTIKLLQSSSSRILSAGFSLLEPGFYIGTHQDYNHSFYRLHIPLIIPKINKKEKNSFVTKDDAKDLCVLQVENDYRTWKDDEYFIFDDTCFHNAWNPSNEIRIVLLVDLLKE